MTPSKQTCVIRRSSSQRGFTLLEVLVAFVLLSLTLGVILQVFSGGLRNATAAGHYATAAIMADSMLARVGRELPLEEGESSGEDGIYRWRLKIEPYQNDTELNQTAAGRYPLYQIILRIQWQYGAQQPELQFNTYRLGGFDAS